MSFVPPVAVKLANCFCPKRLWTRVCVNKLCNLAFKLKPRVWISLVIDTFEVHCSSTMVTTSHKWVQLRVPETARLPN